MSEIHRYQVVTMLSAAGATIGYDPHGPDVVMAAEFDRVTAERDALQALLTVADERADRLESGIKWEAERNALLLASLTEAEDMLSVTSLEAGQRIDLLEGLLRLARQFVTNGVELGYITMPDPETPDAAHDLVPMIDAALKP